MTREPPHWNTLGKDLAGETTPEESAAVRRWLDEHPSDAKAVAALREVTATLAASRPVNVEQALRRVKARGTASRPNVWRFAGIAAAAAILLAIGVFNWPRHTTATKPQVFETAAGARDTVRLADGSTVVLGPGSRLSVTDRAASLAGEAYFDVVHDARRPFTVRSGDVVIRDVGTRFTVHGHAGEPVRVVVTEGSVRVEGSADSVTLGRGDVAVVDAGGGRIEADRGAASADDIAWLAGRLVFRDAPMAQVAEDLAHWYGVQLVVNDSALLRRHFTGSFTNESPDRVLDVIALALGGRVQRRGDSAWISGAGPAR